MNKKFLLLIPIGILLAVFLTFCVKNNDAEVRPTTAPTTEPSVAESLWETDPTETVKTNIEETTVATEKMEPIEETKPAPTIEEDTSGNGFGTGDADTAVMPPKEENNEQQPTPTSPEASLKPTKPQSCGCEYDRYLSMSAADQQAYMSSFSSMEDFISWSKSAAAAHDGHNSGVTVEGGNLDIGDFIG